MSKSVSNKCIAVRKVATPLRELTCYMGSHSVTCHPAEDIPALTPAEAGTRFSDPEGMQGWVDLVGWLHTEMVYPPEDGHPSQYLPGPTWVNFFHATNAANHYTTPPTNSALLSEKNQRRRKRPCQKTSFIRRFDTIPACDKRTDSRTDTRRQHIPR